MNKPERPDLLTQDRHRRRPKRRLWLAMLLVAVPTLLVLGFVIAFPIGAFVVKGFPAKPVPVVSTMIAHYETWEPQIQAVGGFKPVKGADLSVEVAGIVAEVDFDSGGDVQQGAKLMRLIDADEVAKLRTLEAQRDLWQANYKRDEQQLQRQLISQAQFDVTASNLKALLAQIAEQRAIVDKKTLRAPFAGHLGIRNVNVGQYIQPGTVVATLQALDPIFLDFSLPQQILNDVKVGQPVTVKVDTYPDDTFRGEITTIDPKVDPATRNVAVRATIPNPDRKLLPGMFANITIATGATERYITIPQTAVTFNPYGNVVYLVAEQRNKDGKVAMTAQQTFVTTGDRRGDQIAILSGLNEGDQIVSAGQMQLQNGAEIAINNAIQPTNEPDPHPVER